MFNTKIRLREDTCQRGGLLWRKGNQSLQVTFGTALVWMGIGIDSAQELEIDSQKETKEIMVEIQIELGIVHKNQVQDQFLTLD